MWPFLVLNQRYLEALAMLDIKQQKVAQENTAEESGFTEVSGLEVRMHLGKVNGRDMACLFSLLLVLGQQHT